MLMKTMRIPKRGGCMTIDYNLGLDDVCNFYVRLFDVGKLAGKRFYYGRTIYYQRAYSNGGVKQKAYITLPPAKGNCRQKEVRDFT